MIKADELIPPAWAPPTYTAADVAAIQALATGSATMDQQQRALDWIIREAARAYDLDYRPDSREHAFASGRRSVGLHLVTMLKLDKSKLRQAGAK